MEIKNILGKENSDYIRYMCDDNLVDIIDIIETDNTLTIESKGSFSTKTEFIFTIYIYI